MKLLRVSVPYTQYCVYKAQAKVGHRRKRFVSERVGCKERRKKKRKSVHTRLKPLILALCRLPAAIYRVVIINERRKARAIILQYPSSDCVVEQGKIPHKNRIFLYSRALVAVTSFLCSFFAYKKWGKKGDARHLFSTLLCGVFSSRLLLYASFDSTRPNPQSADIFYASVARLFHENSRLVRENRRKYRGVLQRLTKR